MEQEKGQQKISKFTTEKAEAFKQYLPTHNTR
jgi:hypothetical protein